LRKEQEEGRQLIQSRAAKRDAPSPNDNPLNSFTMRHAKALAFVGVEVAHNTLFHFVETMKVRGQARNLKGGDVSHYFANTVEKKPLISGVIPGFMGTAAGATTFMTTFELLTRHFYCGNPAYNDWDFRTKNMAIYLCSDFTGSFSKILFETRKQLIQMFTKDSSMSAILRASLLGWPALAARDTVYRGILLGFYYGTTNIEHKPMLRYSIPQISDFMRHRRATGEKPDETMNDLAYLFYDFHNCAIHTKMTTRITSLICASLLATAVTNPLDVCLSKLLTQ
jgi:hypothetical protein